MSNRLDIELTSIRSDGSYTWRAAGARQPKGVIDAKILTDDAKVGDILRVEAEVEIDGITILGVLPPKEKVTPQGRIELLGSPKPIQAVTTVLLSEGGRGDRRDLLDSPRRGDRSGSRATAGQAAGQSAPTPGDPSQLEAAQNPVSSTDRNAGRVPTEPPQAGPLAVLRAVRPQAPIADRNGGPVQKRTLGPGRPATQRAVLQRPAANAGPNGGRARSKPARPGLPAAQRAGPGLRGANDGLRHVVPGHPAVNEAPATRDKPRPPAPTQQQTPARKAVPRFEPGTVHRDLLFASLASEQRPIAERLAAGGIPAVRRAIAAERERARSEGRPEVTGEAILALAEQLAPSVKQAIWLDRAEAAVAQLDQISLRDLRTTVVAAAPRDEASRDLDRKLREEFDRRVKKLRSNWEEQITHALEEGRVLQALRFSAQPPEPTARFPAALVARLATSAGASMSLQHAS